MTTKATARNKVEHDGPKSVGRTAVPSAPPATLADEQGLPKGTIKKPGQGGVAPVVQAPGAGARRAHHIVKTLALRAFQSLDALVLAFFALRGFAQVSSVSLGQTPFAIAAPFIALPFALAWGLARFGGYQFGYRESFWSHLRGVAGGFVAGMVPILVAAWLCQMPKNDLLSLCLSIALIVGVLFVLHAGYVRLVRHWSAKGLLSANVVIVGATPNARRLIRENNDSHELNLLAIFDDRAARRPHDLDGVPVAGGLNDLLSWERLPQIDTIIITVTSTASRRIRELIDQLDALPQNIVLFMDLKGFNPEGVKLADIARVPMAWVSGGPRDEARAVQKRIQDIIIAGAMLLAFAPVMALIAVLIKLDSPGPVLFRQKRHGFNNEIIEVFKFRSMRHNDEAQATEQVQAGDQRITRIGGFLRRTSLDELPQLFNILAGSMSLVGPRPHAIDMRTAGVESRKLVAHYAHRHRVKPGLTGWAQINGSRGPVHTPEDVRERVRLDMEYINKNNFWMDLLIILKTAPCLLGDGKNTR